MKFNSSVNVFLKRAFFAYETSFKVSFIKMLGKRFLDMFSYRNQDDFHVTVVSYCFIHNIRRPHPHLFQSQNEGTTCRVHLRILLRGYWGHAVAHLVEALRYKPEGCGFDSRWCHLNFSLI
jgi:hypothetical protein